MWLVETPFTQMNFCFMSAPRYIQDADIRQKIVNYGNVGGRE